VRWDLPDGFLRKLEKVLNYLESRLEFYDKLLFANEVFFRRAPDVGIVPKDRAIEWGVTGPNLRACGYGNQACPNVNNKRPSSASASCPTLAACAMAKKAAKKPAKKASKAKKAPAKKKYGAFGSNVCSNYQTIPCMPIQPVWKHPDPNVVPDLIGLSAECFRRLHRI